LALPLLNGHDPQVNESQNGRKFAGATALGKWTSGKPSIDHRLNFAESRLLYRGWMECLHMMNFCFMTNGSISPSSVIRLC